MRLIIGSRGSKLALWQAQWIAEQLARAGHDFEVRIIKTTGDKLQTLAPDQPPPPSFAPTVAVAGSKGLFIKEIEEALLAHEVDLAVHSLKDLPVELPAGLALGAVPPREDARDVLISRGGRPLRDLAPGGRIATSSLRRQAQLRALRADLAYIGMRGNLDTRLGKLERGDCEGLVLAAAGVHRLGVGDRVAAYFSLDEMCPAVGQGALGIEVRADDSAVGAAVAKLNHPPTEQAVRAERALLRRLGGGCQVPVAAFGEPNGARLRLHALVANVDGARMIRAQRVGLVSDAEGLGEAVAGDLLGQGAGEILDAVAKAQRL